VSNFSPMLCVPATRAEAELLCASGQWVAQRKFDGVRAYIKGGRLYDRRGNDITEKFPEFALQHAPHQFIIDGEIVADTFETVAGRIHMRPEKARLSARFNPCTFVAFDCVASGCMHAGVMQRLDWLHNALAERTLPWLVVAGTCAHTFTYVWERAEQESWEGVVIKRVESPYVCGRSDHWRKVKRWSETTHTFTVLERHSAGVRLSDGEGRSVTVNGAQAAEVERVFATHARVSGTVQFLAQESGAWRFPSWRGLAKEKQQGKENDEEEMR
jgi:ATP-dependent DNA ligase